MQDEIHLKTLKGGCPTLSEAKGGGYCEMASVCLDHLGHPVDTKWKVSGSYSLTPILHRTEVGQAHRLSNADLQEATEHGSYGLAILIVKHLKGYPLVRRSWKGTGVDFFFSKGESLDPFQDSARLEVSGILRGGEAEIRRRVEEKLEQSRVSDGDGIPKFVVIVEYSQLRAEVIFEDA